MGKALSELSTKAYEAKVIVSEDVTDIEKMELKETNIKIDQINPIKYARDRNFTDGSVSNLSPYISRGVISTKFVYDFLFHLR